MQIFHSGVFLYEKSIADFIDFVFKIFGEYFHSNLNIVSYLNSLKSQKIFSHVSGNNTIFNILYFSNMFLSFSN
jgi:hypothetical protein